MKRRFYHDSEVTVNAYNELEDENKSLKKRIKKLENYLEHWKKTHLEIAKTNKE